MKGLYYLTMNVSVDLYHLVFSCLQCNTQSCYISCDITSLLALIYFKYKYNVYVTQIRLRI